MILDFINNIDKLNHINTETVDSLSTLHTHNIFNNKLNCCYTYVYEVVFINLLLFFIIIHIYCIHFNVKSSIFK